MRRIILIVLLFTLSNSLAQDTRRLDSLLQNSEFNKVIQEISADNTSAVLQNKLAEAYIYSGRFDDAEKTLSKIQSASEVDRALTLTNFGLLYMNQGRHDKALESLQQAISILERDGKSESLAAAQAISNLGMVYTSTGKTTQAQEQLLMALSLREKLLNKNHVLIAASYNDIGLSYAGHDNDMALDYYEKALAIYQSLYGKEHPKTAIALVNTGFVYRDLELYGDAINNFENALKIWEKVYPNAHPAKAFALSNLGDTYLMMRNNQAAKGYYDKALAMYRESYGTHHPDIAQVLNSMGNLQLVGNKFDQALTSYQQAMQSNITGFTNNNVASNPKAENYYNGRVLLYSLLYKAQAFEKRYFGKTLKLNDLRLALNTLHVADSLIDELRQHSTNENDKISLGAIANEVYADGVRIAHEIALNSPRKRKWLDDGFYFAEKSKSAVLLEAISDANAKSFAGIPAETMEEEKNLKSAIALTAQKLSQKPSTEEEKYLRESLYALNRDYESFTKKLEKDFPEYFNLKFNASSPSTSQLQNILASKSAILSYFIDDKNSRLYVFFITNKTFRVFDKSVPKDFDRYITGLRNSLFFNEIKTYKMTARSLAETLIPRMPSSIDDLIILPSGRMSIIPFESLLTKKSDDITNYKSLPYLINKYKVRYEFSASLLLEKTRKKITDMNSIFLCAPVTFPTHADLPELQGTESEVKEIAKLFASKNYATSVKLNAAASENLVKQNATGNHSVVHFATHGVVDERNPELSRIFLQSENSSEDGNLFSGEIYNLNLNANLVTLSACQTGLGKISKGEGVIGLSRALVYAGAKNIIVSYWSVADESTAQLMKNFYRILIDSKNQNFSGSLRNSKLELIKTDNFSAPYYWAPFILIGY